MTGYRRSYPRFSLCGLNCGLCPRHHTRGTSRCPGCGGPDFALQHPSCAVITCNRRHDRVEYCFQCSSYPCPRYREPSSVDSFISYRNVLPDLEKAKTLGLERYQAELDEKVKMLELLLERFDDGRRKSFYCNAVNLMSLSDIRTIVQRVDLVPGCRELDPKGRARLLVDRLTEKANERGIALALRK